MSQPDRVEEITRLVEPLAASLGLEVWGVEIAGQSRPVARIYVDIKPDAHPGSESDAELSPAGTDAVRDEAISESEPTDSVQNLTEDGEDADFLGVSVDQCAHLSRLLGLALDVEDPFADNWTLEVSSPGLERVFFRIDQMRSCIGREITVTLLDPLAGLPGRKRFSGELARVDDEEFVLTLSPATKLADAPDSVTIAWPSVRKAHLIHHFPEPGKKNLACKQRPVKKSGTGSGNASGGTA